ncbi:hypothetical protein EYW49_22000 [Siculibacillus lacustris]|uniref:Right-handed parallel beta-helix repeat-containing protein n=1 Tax=Siculibacillus lacustris TaxID=1549641 RepID=A0A4Q9VF21_9HYPH|nr:hypothetical protein [Siculibacillus lacustris]TBW32614.1 hypothetical protein EYW49_22000 [Siculibacillus lacustris]
MRPLRLLAGGLGIGGGGGGTSFDTFYVDAVNGSDSNSGAYPSQAWKTTDKVSSLSYSPGARVLFKRGQSFPLSDTLRLRPNGGSNRKDTDTPVYVGAYGGTVLDPLPKLSSWKYLDPAGWSLYSSNIWRIDANAAVLRTGSQTSGSDGANIGRLLVDGAIKTYRRQSIAECVADWDFYADDTQYLYVRAPANPSALAAEIRAAPNVWQIGMDPGIKIRDIWFEGTGGHACNVGSNTDVQWCVMHIIGGSNLSGHRYGDGFQQFGGAQNVTCKNCLFWENYDSALTIQGYPMNTSTSGWDNVDLSDNWVARCQSALELWATYGAAANSGTCPPGSGFRTVAARRLHLFDVGRGFSRLGRWDYLAWSALVQNPTETPYFPVPISISEMKNCSDTLLFGPAPIDPLPPSRTGSVNSSDYRFEVSALSLPSGSRIDRKMTYTVEQFIDYNSAAIVKFDQSTMAIEPSGSTGFADAVLTPFANIYASWLATHP